MNTMIRSNYLNTDIPVQMYEAYNEREEKVLIITHASLEHFLFDQLPAYMRNLKVSVRYSLETIYVSDTVASFLCKIEDTAGRVVFNTGESDRSLMKNDPIGMKNYIRIAKNRAIDAALIRYLDLPTVEGKVGKIYSSAEDLEGMTYEKKQPKQLQSMNNSQPIQTTNYTPQQNTGNFMTELTNTPADWSQFIIQFGWAKNQPIEYVYQTNGGRDWLLKMVSEAESRQLNSSEGIAQYPMIKAFLHQKGEL